MYGVCVCVLYFTIVVATDRRCNGGKMGYARRYWRRHRGHARPQRARYGGVYVRQNHGTVRGGGQSVSIRVCVCFVRKNGGGTERPPAHAGHRYYIRADAVGRRGDSRERRGTGVEENERSVSIRWHHLPRHRHVTHLLTFGLRPPSRRRTNNPEG